MPRLLFCSSSASRSRPDGNLGSPVGRLGVRAKRVGVLDEGLVADPVGDDFDLYAKPASAVFAEVCGDLDRGILGYLLTLLSGDGSEGT
jgi:hypothetical protein